MFTLDMKHTLVRVSVNSCQHSNLRIIDPMDFKFGQWVVLSGLMKPFEFTKITIRFNVKLTKTI